MIEIEFQDHGKDVSLLFIRIAFVAVLAMHVVFKIDNPTHDLMNILALLVMMLVYCEMRQVLPHKLAKVIVAKDFIEFIYVGPVGTKLSVGLPITDDIEFKRSFWSNRVSIISGSNAVKLPWFLSNKDQNDIQKVLAKNP